MLDQSFSAHNFETIYCLESRKGNIDIQTMPEEYRDVLARSEELKKVWGGKRSVLFMIRVERG